MTIEWKTKKLVSKLCRLQLADELERIIRVLPFTRLDETQVGAYVYAGNGTISIGLRSVPATLRASIIDGEPRMVLESRQSGIRAEFPLDEGAARRAVNEAVRRAAC